MVVCFCPACGSKVYVKNSPDGEYPVCFKHCGHEITVEKEGEK